MNASCSTLKYGVIRGVRHRSRLREISKSQDFTEFQDFERDFKISSGISGFRARFQDFRRDFTSRAGATPFHLDCIRWSAPPNKTFFLRHCTVHNHSLCISWHAQQQIHPSWLSGEDSISPRELMRLWAGD